MSDIFVSQPGRVVRIRGNRSVPGTVTLLNANMGSVMTSQRVVITGFGASNASHVQFMQSLLRTIYMYSFGDRIGQVQVQGIGFSSMCGQSSNGSGVEDILDYWTKYRVSQNNDPVNVSIGRKIIKGFLTACEIRSVSVEHMTYGWSFQIASIPNDPTVTGGSNTSGSSNSTATGSPSLVNNSSSTRG